MKIFVLSTCDSPLGIEMCMARGTDARNTIRFSIRSVEVSSFHLHTHPHTCAFTSNSNKLKPSKICREMRKVFVYRNIYKHNLNICIRILLKYICE